MGQPGDLGALAQGRKADLVLLRTDSIFLRPLADPVKALVYAETGASVDTVLVDGRVVLDQGHVTTVDETRIYARAQEAADRHREAPRTPGRWPGAWRPTWRRRAGAR
jgi:cytosine/adenosine deaminase-related metal-dependent hydrolase